MLKNLLTRKDLSKKIEKLNKNKDIIDKNANLKLNNLNDKIVNNLNNQINNINFNKDQFSKTFIKELKTIIPLNENNYINTLNSVKWNSNGKDYILKIDLFPENLGKIEIILSKTDNSIIGKIISDSDFINEKIKTNIENILNSLNSKGINISNLNISTFSFENNNSKDFKFENSFEKGNNFNLSIKNKENNIVNNDLINLYYSDLYIGRKINKRI